MIKHLKKSLILSFSLALLIPSVTKADTNVTRISGIDRYETDIKIQQNCYPKASGNLAVLSSGTEFRTALYGSYMANALKIPYYVTPNNTISKSLLEEIKNKSIKRIYIIGNYNIINKSIENRLKLLGIKITRFQDKYEYGEIQEISHYIDSVIFETFHEGEPRGDINNGILVNDKKFPDLLSSIPFVSSLIREQGTFFGGLDDFNTDPSDEGNLAEGWRFIIGGKNSIPSYIETFRGDKLGLNLHYWNDESHDDSESFYTGRIAGEDRYKTAVEIAKSYKPVLNRAIDTVIIVDGTNYPDALASGTIAAIKGGAILLTEPGKLNEDTKAFLKENNIKNIIIVGGEKSVSKKVENELKSL